MAFGELYPLFVFSFRTCPKLPDFWLLHGDGVVSGIEWRVGGRSDIAFVGVADKNGWDG